MLTSHTSTTYDVIKKRPNHKGSVKGQKRNTGFDPFLAAVSYKLGGVAYFLVDKNKGTRVSSVYLHWPGRCHPINSSVMNCNERIPTEDPTELKHEFLRLVGDNSTYVQEKKRGRLMFKAQWADGHVSWISAYSAISTIPESTYIYAEKSGLLTNPDWFMLKGISFSANNTEVQEQYNKKKRHKRYKRQSFRQTQVKRVRFVDTPTEFIFHGKFHIYIFLC
jgi:hypothetical protein